MSSYKLHYFDFRGRGEILRLLFAYAGQQYEDIRILRPSWDSVKQNPCHWDRVKQNYLFDKLPILEIDGKPYGQSMALAGYLARQFGIHGKTDKEILEVEQVLGICGDVLAAFVVGHLEKDPERKAAILKDNKERLYPRFVRFFETVLKNNKTGFYVGDKMGLSDIAAFDTLDIRVDDSILQGFPLVKANLEKVRANQGIAQWLAKRPPAHH